MKVFVVSLKKSVERRKAIEQQLNELEIKFDFFDAIYGADYYDNPLFFNKEKSLKYELRTMLPGEVGCSLSHIEIYKKIVEENLDYAFILEDDAIISKDIKFVLPEIEKHIKQNDLLTLEKCDIYKKRGAIHLYNEYYIVKPKLVKYGSMAQTAGYIITKEAAQKIISINFPVYVPADSWGQYTKVINFRGIIPSKTLIHQALEFDSTITEKTRNTNGKSTTFSLLFYAFYTRCPFGRFLKNVYKKIRS